MGGQGHVSCPFNGQMCSATIEIVILVRTLLIPQMPIIQPCHLVPVQTAPPHILSHPWKKVRHFIGSNRIVQFTIYNNISFTVVEYRTRCHLTRKPNLSKTNTTHSSHLSSINTNWLCFIFKILHSNCLYAKSELINFINGRVWCELIMPTTNCSLACCSATN